MSEADYIENDELEFWLLDYDDPRGFLLLGYGGPRGFTRGIWNLLDFVVRI